MTRRVFNKGDLKRFIVNTVWGVLPENSKVDRVAMCQLINSRVDICFQPLEEWIASDGELDSIIEIVDKIIEDEGV